MISEELKIMPREYSFNARMIYSYFKRRKISVDYSNKLLRVLNLWGKFYCHKHGNLYEPVPSLVRGQVVVAISSAQKRKTERVRRASLPLDEKRLNAIPRGERDNLGSEERKMELEAWNYLFCTLWLGLRPVEVRMILSGKYTFIDENFAGDLETAEEYEEELLDETASGPADSGRHQILAWSRYFDDEARIEVLKVYQTKLVGLQEENRYKLIPLLHESQKQAATLLEEGKVKIPHSSTIQKWVGDGYHQYCGRKGFMDHMLKLGEDPLCISAWLGHSDLKTTMDHYKNRQKVMIKRTA
jgi:hypothetical protein